MAEENTADYEIKDIIRRHGGVCILVYIPSLDKDISVNSSEQTFNEMTEYEIKRQVEESVSRFLYKPPQTAIASGDKVSNLKSKFVGKHMIGDAHAS